MPFFAIKSRFSGKDRSWHRQLWRRNSSRCIWQDREVRRLSASRSANSCHPKRRISFRTSCIGNAGYPVLFFRIVSIPCSDSKDIPRIFLILAKIFLLFRRCASFFPSLSQFFGASAYRRAHLRKDPHTFPSMQKDSFFHWRRFLLISVGRLRRNQSPNSPKVVFPLKSLKFGKGYCIKKTGE